jgi:hypothetical protein
MLASVALAVPAASQVSLDLGADVDVGVGVRVGEPYTYDGYYSGRWYPYDEPRRTGRWYEAYGGYDCYHAFQYTWDDGHRTRYESYWCFDERGREYEVRRTRVLVRID